MPHCAVIINGQEFLLKCNLDKRPYVLFFPGIRDLPVITAVELMMHYMDNGQHNKQHGCEFAVYGHIDIGGIIISLLCTKKEELVNDEEKEVINLIQEYNYNVQTMMNNDDDVVNLSIRSREKAATTTPNEEEEMMVYSIVCQTETKKKSLRVSKNYMQNIIRALIMQNIPIYVYGARQIN